VYSSCGAGTDAGVWAALSTGVGERSLLVLRLRFGGGGAVDSGPGEAERTVAGELESTAEGTDGYLAEEGAAADEEGEEARCRLRVRGATAVWRRGEKRALGGASEKGQESGTQRLNVWRRRFC
jgi:hypothetical protein